MGVSGSGKTTLGQALAQALGRPFIEGDRLHPPANLAKMASGIALTDEDRRPFLDNVAQALRAAPGPAVASCSALKRVYRDRLRTVAGRILFVMSRLTRAELEQRMARRSGHFMPASLLESQLATLEPPEADEDALLIDGALALEDQVAHLLAALAARER
ncbi:MAG: gluconokinase [Sphingobium sp.]|nr:gluconokinase [Sphingobium sp.]